jgi:AcrR family transcriptional regulator
VPWTSNDPVPRPDPVASPSSGRGGRPRDPDVDGRIRDATLSILVESGYGAVTMESVARRAKVAHTTVYRRWPSKVHLVHEVLFPDTDAFVVPPGASVTDLLTALVHRIVENLSRPEARAALPGLLGEYQADGPLHGRLSDRFAPALADAITEAFAAAAGRGEVRPGIDGATVLDTILGYAVVSLFLHEDRPVDERAAALVDLLRHGVDAPPG